MFVLFYIRPRPQTLSIPGVTTDTENDLQDENRGPVDDYSEDSLASGSSGFGSLPRKTRTSLVTAGTLEFKVIL